ncbi:uncharacterized protein LOC112568769 isoform X2 [Pomacea canaliculata]|uniref:uncharacterized protein LOC112568769 isoform X2 n=1 Tax=Pomacea canaliculata TaxID=400727 RepID=UPI000D72FC8E|nr:uncharacterized protein LOC112568769 isoform X2 [Pomacea canaliculata]
MVSLGTCTRTLTCTLRHTAVSSLVRPAATFVSMELYATRAMAGRLVCSQVSSNGATDSANCDHDVVSPFEMMEINVNTNLEDWTLTADFSTSKVFSALGVYDVDIRENIAGISDVYFHRLSSTTTQTSLTAYNLSSTEYYRGKLTAKWSMPSRGGNYYYTADLVPSRQTGVRIHPKNGWMNILEPEPPQTNCPLTFIPEVGPFNCQCSTKSLGRPAGRLQWLVGNDVIASGGYGVTELQLPTNRVNRMHDGMQIICQLDWVVKQHVFVTGSVAYGPKDLRIKVHSKNCLVIATCTVDDVKPFSSDLVQWGGLCQGQRGTVCTFTSRGEEDNGKEVTCTVINQANNGHTVSSRAKVTVSACGDKGNDVAANNTVIVVQSDSVIVSKSVAISFSVSLSITVAIELFLRVGLKWITKGRRRDNNQGRNDGSSIWTSQA